MVVYNLRCDIEHQFEGWFKSKDDYDEQLDCGLLVCPVCGSEHVTRLDNADEINPNKSEQQIKELAEIQYAASQLSKKINNYVQNNYEDVGELFAHAVRKIYYREESEHSFSHDEMSFEEALDLYDDGVEVLPLASDKPDKDKLN